MVSISLYLAFKKAAFLLDYRAALEGNYTVLFWQFCLLLNGGIFFWRLALYKAYQPAPTWPDKWLPSVTVIVPAYNEGRQVLDTLRSVAASDYPPEKLQIISVDDGSRDDTWSWMRRAEAELGSRIELLRLPVNQGKRRALYEGFKRSRGDVLVTIDSDSLIENRTLRHMVAPFCQDPQVGGVAGNVRV
ncbi:MAG: glycosyltransferase family 2 protein, partial [Proteobacteria bacterium]|nr:glycosyltransferase family 2 protein [Pseudomonadota bacterium]